VRIGNINVFREHVTIHRSNSAAEPTTIGSNNLLMVNSHLGHNGRIGDHVILANGALLAGHTVVGNRAFISGNCLVHQFVRVGSLALMQGGSAVSKDLPPFTIARGHNGICGLNIVGLRRASVPSEQRLELKRLYRRLFRGGQNLQQALDGIDDDFPGELSRQFIEFVRSSKRGICFDCGAQVDLEA
jgi:UDP-N-acetylglucosamine acyltransferase